MQLTWRKAVCPPAVSSSMNALSSTGMSQKIGGGNAADVREVAQEPCGEIDQVNALIDQFAAAESARVRSPLPVVADAPAVPVAGPKEHQRTERPAVDQRRAPRAAPDDSDG